MNEFASIFHLFLIGLMRGGIYVLLSMGLTLIYGTMEVVNFAQSSFMMLAMYSAFWLFEIFAVDPYLSLIINVPLFFLVGVVMYKTLLRRVMTEATRKYQMLLTFGLYLIVNNLVLVFWSYDIKFILTDYSLSTFDIFNMSFLQSIVFSFLAALAGSALLYVFLEKTFTGLAIRATVQNKEAAEVLGIDTNRIYTLVMGIGVALAGVAGVLLATFYPIQPYVADSFMLIVFIVSVLGGLGDYKGAFISGLIMGIVEVFFAAYVSPMFKHVVYFVVFALVISVRPEGLFGKLKRRR